jgi:acyl carrier protein
MADPESITRSLFTVINKFNRGLPPDKQLEKAPGGILFGKGGPLDSLGLVNLIVATEQQIEEDFGIPISLADERAMSQETSPFRTVDRLVNYIALLLKEQKNQ